MGRSCRPVAEVVALVEIVDQPGPDREQRPATLISREDSMTASTAVGDPIRVGVIADQTGALVVVEAAVELLAQYDGLYPGDAKFTGGGGCSGLYRGIALWAAAVTEAGSLTQADVIAALDHAEIAQGPGGPAAMVPGQHHVRMNMYIAQARSGRFEIVKSLGALDPQEPLVEAPALVD